MLMELERLRGTVIGAVPGAALTELRPEGLTTGTILVASAGLDESNAPEGSAIGWPRNPVMSAGRLRKELETRMRSYELRVTSFGKSENPHPKPETRNPKPRVAVIMTDSCCVPRRSGVTAMALVVSGFNPLQPQKGRKDLFGKPLRMTTEAVADQLATAANFLMGNAAQSIPAVIIRDHGLELTEWEGWVPGIEPERDLFQGVL